MNYKPILLAALLTGCSGTEVRWTKDAAPEVVRRDMSECTDEALSSGKNYSVAKGECLKARGYQQETIYYPSMAEIYEQQKADREAKKAAKGE